jgi:hypothetical protein
VDINFEGKLMLEIILIMEVSILLSLIINFFAGRNTRSYSDAVNEAEKELR